MNIVIMSKMLDCNQVFPSTVIRDFRNYCGWFDLEVFFGGVRYRPKARKQLTC